MGFTREKPNRNEMSEKSLRDRLADDLPDGFEWSAADLEMLEQGEGLLSTIAELEKLIAEQGVTIVGASGQPRLNAAVAELRQARAQVARIVGLLAVSTERASSPASRSRYRHTDPRRK